MMILIRPGDARKVPIAKRSVTKTLNFPTSYVPNPTEAIQFHCGGNITAFASGPE
jgi:hypothetical protein